MAIEKISFDTKYTNYSILNNMGFSQNIQEIDKVGDLLSFVILPKNDFLIYRKVIIVQLKDRFYAVRGKEYIDSYLYLVNNIKRFNLSSYEERLVKDFSFEYNIVFVDSQDELNEIISLINVMK